METKPEKLLRRSLFAVASLSDCKTTLLLPTPMAVSQLYASIAQQTVELFFKDCHWVPEENKSRSALQHMGN